MPSIFWLLRLLLKAAIFFTLFAFALNNQHDVTVNFFFGTRWRGPLVLVVLGVFATGVLLGAVGMAPRWWRHRRASAAAAAAPASTLPGVVAPEASDDEPETPTAPARAGHGL